MSIKLVEPIIDNLVTIFTDDSIGVNSIITTINSETTSAKYTGIKALQLESIADSNYYLKRFEPMFLTTAPDVFIFPKVTKIDANMRWGQDVLKGGHLIAILIAYRADTPEYLQRALDRYMRAFNQVLFNNPQLDVGQGDTVAGVYPTDIDWIGMWQEKSGYTGSAALNIKVITSEG